MRRGVALLAVGLLAVVVSSTSASGASSSIPGDPGLFLNILPAGQGASASASTGYPGQNPPHTDDQLGMYESLPLAAGPGANLELSKYFKPETFTLPASEV